MSLQEARDYTYSEDFGWFLVIFSNLAPFYAFGFAYEQQLPMMRNVKNSNIYYIIHESNIE
jgi:hypothetical protein